MIRCRCGRSFPSAPFLRAFWTALPFCPFATTAAFPMIRCRCGATFSSAPFPLLPKELSKSLSHLPKVCGFSAFPSHLPKVRKSRIASKRSVVAFVPFMISFPSEGAGRNGILPPPSHFRYVPIRIRDGSRWSCHGSLPGRCRQRWHITVTFRLPSDNRKYTSISYLPAASNILCSKCSIRQNVRFIKARKLRLSSRLIRRNIIVLRRNFSCNKKEN